MLYDSDRVDSDTWYISFLFLMYFPFLHNTDEAWYDFIFCNYVFHFTKQITNSISKIFLSFPFLSNLLSHYVLSLSTRFHGLHSSTYISPVVIRCTLEIVYFEYYNIFYFSDLSLTSSNSSCISKRFYLSVEL